MHNNYHLIEIQCVFSEVQTEFLYIMQMDIRLENLLYTMEFLLRLNQPDCQPHRMRWK